MEQTLMHALSNAGGYCAIGLASIGSSAGAGVAGMAAVGAWKRCYIQNKPAPFLLLALAGAPLSQTIYGMILMMVIRSRVETADPYLWPFYLIMGIMAGIGFMMSSYWQGKAAASACDAFGETEKGFANDLMILGVVETVAIFVLVFALMVV